MLCVSSSLDLSLRVDVDGNGGWERENRRSAAAVRLEVTSRPSLECLCCNRHGAGLVLPRNHTEGW